MKNKDKRTWVEINLRNLVYNFHQVKKIVGKNIKILAPVKANAYGHGIVETAKILAYCGADYLGVANTEEAQVLKRAGLKTPILILGAMFSSSEIKQALKLNVRVTVPDYRTARLLDRWARLLGKKKVPVHIKIDTGMGRIGVWHTAAEDFIVKVAKLNRIFIEGLYTHFSSADTDMAFTGKQVEIFEGLLRRLKAKKIEIPFKHASNSSAVGRLRDLSLNMVRPGIMLYGMYPHKNLEEFFDLKPVLSFKSRIVYLKDVAAGRSISYGRTFTARANTRVATVAVGYADGYMRALSNRAKVIIRNKYARVIGRVCMDQIMVDVGHIPKVKIGDEVILIGAAGKKRVSAEDLAKICSTIPYEISCAISERIPRFFKRD
ncbi:MAG: alanine racemase [Candidatus Omnitrophica bacterium]|nr:alanine racemase [Candidatus Omnitrophota bacterium]